MRELGNPSVVLRFLCSLRLLNDLYESTSHFQSNVDDILILMF